MRTARALIAATTLAAGGVVLPLGQAVAAAPVVSRVEVGPVRAGAPVTITAAVDAPDPGGVVLDVVVGFGAVQARPMADDGRSGDGAAGDGVFGATVPAQPAGTLVRHRVRSGAVAAPQPQGQRRYDGFVVAPPPVASAAPVVDWFVAPADYEAMRADPDDRTYRPAVLVVDGVVYDGVEVRPQGGRTAVHGPKPNFKFKLPSSTKLGPPLFDHPVNELVADADFEDPTYSVNVVANEMSTRHGVPPRQVTTVRMQRNGGFFGIYQLIEEHDGDWRDRVGFDVASHYEGESTRTFLVDEGDPAALVPRFSLEHPDDGDMADLAALARALDSGPSDDRARVVADTFDVPQLVDLLALSAIIQNWDTISGNWSLLRDADTGRWRMLTNDLDLVLGLRGRTRNPELLPPTALGTTSPLFGDERFAAMFHRRVRTLLDTELTQAAILGRIDANTAGLGPEMALDRATWGLATPSFAAGRADVADFVAWRRSLVLAHQRPGQVPAAQEPTAGVVVSEVRPGGAPAGDFVELANPSTIVAVDVSGWQLQGAASARLPGGSVVPPGDRLVVPVDPATMAARGEGVLVAGRLADELPAAGTVTVVDGAGTPRDSVTWGADGAGPAPGDGRSLEALTLGAEREGSGGWRPSAEPGGTPGARGPSGTPLQVDLWTGRWAAPAAEPFEVQVRVANRGDRDLTGVTVDVTGTTCDRTVGALAAGEVRTWWCPARPTGSGRSHPVVAHGRAAGGHHDSGTAVVSVVDPLVLPRPTGIRVTMAPGGLRVDYRDPAPLAPGQAPWVLRTWRVEAQVASGRGPATSRVVGRNGTVLRDLPAGEPTSVRVAARSTLVLGLPTPRAPGITPRPAVTWPYASTADLVRDVYRTVGGRTVPAAELALWAHAIDGGTPPADLVSVLLAEPRWSVDATAVARLYRAVLGRAPMPRAWATGSGATGRARRCGTWPGPSPPRPRCGCSTAPSTTGASSTASTGTCWAGHPTPPASPTGSGACARGRAGATSSSGSASRPRAGGGSGRGPRWPSPGTSSPAPPRRPRTPRWPGPGAPPAGRCSPWSTRSAPATSTPPPAAEAAWRRVLEAGQPVLGDAGGVVGGEARGRQGRPHDLPGHRRAVHHHRQAHAADAGPHHHRSEERPAPHGPAGVPPRGRRPLRRGQCDGPGAPSGLAPQPGGRAPGRGAAAGRPVPGDRDPPHRRGEGRGVAGDQADHPADGHLRGPDRPRHRRVQAVALSWGLTPSERAPRQAGAGERGRDVLRRGEGREPEAGSRRLRPHDRATIHTPARTATAT